MTLGLLDAVGTHHLPAAQDARIACLVPSITELLFALDLGTHVVARTGFCVHPRVGTKRVPKVGGTKDFDLDRLRAAAPTHLIVNVDENPRMRVEAAAKFIPHVIVTHPMGPLDNPPLYRLLGGIFGREREAEALASSFEAAYCEAVEATAGLATERVLYLIWKDPWMTISRDTYIARTLEAVGWEPIAIESADRYPAIELEKLVSEVDRVLLSSEPYAFTHRDVQAVERLIASQTTSHQPRATEVFSRATRHQPPATEFVLPVAHHQPPATVSLIDAQMTSWYGSRAIEGMRYLADLRVRARPASGHQVSGRRRA